MRKSGRSRWNEEDHDIAAETTMRLAILGGFAPLYAYEQAGFGSFPYVQGNDGTWIKCNAA